MTNPTETSLPVPEVVGTAISGATDCTVWNHRPMDRTAPTDLRYQLATQQLCLGPLRSRHRWPGHHRIPPMSIDQSLQDSCLCRIARVSSKMDVGESTTSVPVTLSISPAATTQDPLRSVVWIFPHASVRRGFFDRSEIEVGRRQIGQRCHVESRSLSVIRWFRLGPAVIGLAYLFDPNAF